MVYKIYTIVLKDNQEVLNNPNPDLEIYIYGLPELLNNVIASAAKQSRFRLVSCAGLRPIFACIKPLVL